MFYRQCLWPSTWSARSSTCMSDFLVQVEEELKSTISSWERDNENVFLVNGERYLDVMERQWLCHEEEKKRAVAERVQNFKFY